MDRFLITGATGFLGSHLCHKLRNATVVGMARDGVVMTRWLNEALGHTNRVRGDVTNYDDVRRVISEYQPDAVIHTAALAAVKIANKDPLTTYKSNILGTVNVLEACRVLGVKNVVAVNSDKVYGHILDATEKSPYLYSGPYETSKACDAMIIESYRHFYGLNVIMPVFSNLYGYDEMNDRIVPNIIRACRLGQNPKIFSATKDMLRQYIYIDDAVDAILGLLADGPELNTSYPENLYKREAVFNFPGANKTQEQVVLEILKHFPDLKAEYVEGERTKELMLTTMKPTITNWEPEHTFEEGIAKSVDFFKVYDREVVSGAEP